MYLINHRLGDRLLVAATDNAFPCLQNISSASGVSLEGKVDEKSEMVKAAVEQKCDGISWSSCNGNQNQQGMKFCLKHSKVTFVLSL